MNQFNIHDFYNIFLFSNPNHFYVIYTIIQNEWNLIDTIYNSNFALNPPHYNLHLINNLSFWHAFNSPRDEIIFASSNPSTNEGLESIKLTTIGQ
jgi:hypothetical protein